jgi:hypothetical protein
MLALLLTPHHSSQSKSPVEEYLLARITLLLLCGTILVPLQQKYCASTTLGLLAYLERVKYIK